MKVILNVCTILIVSICLLKLVESKNCNKKLRDAEYQVKKILFLSEDMKIPRTGNDMKQYCSEAKQAFQIARNYTDCLKSFPQRIFKTFLTSTNRAMAETCGKRVNPDDVAQKIRCFTPKVLAKCFECMNEATKQLNYIADNVPTGSILPYVCCTFHTVSSCVFDKLKNNCQDGNVEGARFFKKNLDLMFVDMNSLICRKTADLKACETSEPQVMTNLRKAAKTKLEDPSRTFFIKPLLQIAEKMVDG